MEYKSLFILGRQPAIGLAELESLFGAESLRPVGSQAVICKVAPSEINFSRLGGSIRLAKIVTQLETTQLNQLNNGLAKELPALLDNLPEGKVKLGLSSFDLNLNPRQLMHAGLELKKACKKAGRSARLAPNTEESLSSAQVIHNQLVGSVGIEILLVKDGAKTIVAQTLHVQDIAAYARRDQGRPKRDARVGMLPPKLAQIIVNLATSDKTDQTVLDPFCGTGVVLQEALLMDFQAYGTDLEPRMVDFSRQNLEWLATHRNSTPDQPLLHVGDATSYRWEHPFSTIASEAYLGQPLNNLPGTDKLHEIMGNCNVIIEKFLRNLATQTKPGFRLCLAVPAWLAPNRTYHLRLLDHLEDLGYNRIKFQHVNNDRLLYYRPDQIVARELLVITRK